MDEASVLTSGAAGDEAIVALNLTVGSWICR